jgi:hypothetical protein
VKLPRLPALRFDHLLGGLVALFAVAALWPWFAPDAGSAPRPEKPASTLPGLTALPPPAVFSAIVDRPLFSPTRRPVPGAASGGPAAGLEARYRLLGLVVSETVHRAWLAEGTRHFELGEGDKLDGWTVTRIEQDRMVLTSPSGEAVFSLRRPSEDSAAKETPQKAAQ